MKKTILSFVFLSLLICLGLLAGCSSSSSSPSNSSNKKDDYADEAFIKSLGEGLEAHWQKSDELGYPENTDILQALYKAELDCISPYKSAKFKDAELKEKALKYIEILDNCYTNANYFFNQYSNTYQEYSSDRLAMLYDFATNYGLTVDDKYKTRLDDDVKVGKLAAAESENREAVKELVEGLKFELTAEDEYGYKTYTAIFENTLDVDISDISLSVNMLDADGVIIGTEGQYLSNVKAGQKAKMEFQTDLAVADTDITLDYFSIQ